MLSEPATLKMRRQRSRPKPSLLLQRLAGTLLPRRLALSLPVMERTVDVALRPVGRDLCCGPRAFSHDPQAQAAGGPLDWPTFLIVDQPRSALRLGDAAASGRLERLGRRRAAPGWFGSFGSVAWGTHADGCRR